MGEDGEKRMHPSLWGAPACPRPPEGFSLSFSLSHCGVWTAVSGDQVTGGAGTSSVLADVCVCAERLDAITTITLLELSYATFDSTSLRCTLALYHNDSQEHIRQKKNHLLHFTQKHSMFKFSSMRLHYNIWDSKYIMT